MIGIDLVHIPTFLHKIKDIDVKKKLFSQEESHHPDETLAGIFAAKEAFVKASGKEPDWQAIMILHSAEGKPELRHPDFSHNAINVSITHEKDYACSVVMIR